MFVTLLKSKIHRVNVTEADLDYIGSITIDSDLMDASGIIENERVDIYDINNGNRISTYAIRGEAGSGVIGINGAAAHQVHVGDLIIIASYAMMTPDEAKTHKPTVIFPKDNKI
ncbi:MAG: aspartate 1-decarboxylase [Bacteroidales bacterium]|nr:aspartate 1-decarboxylase [Bacteroidales bacterium]